MNPIIGKSYVTQGYGKTDFAKANPKLYKNFGGIHPGIDFGTSGVNRECVATVPGKIVFAGSNGGWGNYVEVMGEDGWRRQYAHLSAIFVKVGDIVAAGAKLGRVGTSGASTGVHLHYGNRRRTLLGTWEYRNPSGDLEDKVVEAKMPTGKVIKGSLPEIYAFNGKMKFHIPDMETLNFFFPTAKVQEVGEDIVSKIPNGGAIPSMK